MTTANIPPVRPSVRPPRSLLLSNKCKNQEKTETQGLAVPIINHYMLMSFHTQRSVSVCVFACLNVYSCRRVHKWVCVQTYACISECVCVCVTENREDSLTPLQQRPNTSKPQTIYANPARSLKSTSFTFSLHFSNKY